MHHDFQTYQEEQKQPFSWIIILLGLQIFIGVIILIIWSIRIVNKGKMLAKNIDAKKNSVDEENITISSGVEPLAEQDYNNIDASANLFKLAKDFLIAKLNYQEHDSEKMKQKRLLLEEHLNLEYEKM